MIKHKIKVEITYDEGNTSVGYITMDKDKTLSDYINLPFMFISLELESKTIIIINKKYIFNIKELLE